MTPALGTLAGVSLHRNREGSIPDRLPWRHALSLFGDIKYPADFKRFDYVNPDAPKGGTVRQYAIGTFDNFNLVVEGVKGSLASPVNLIYEELTSAIARRGRRFRTDNSRKPRPIRTTALT